MIAHLFAWFEHAVGMTNGSGPEYLFWSGFGSDLSEFIIFGGIISVFRQHNCHVKGCWRWGKHPFQQYKLCARHHPNVPKKLTHLHIVKLHKTATIATEGKINKG